MVVQGAVAYQATDLARNHREVVDAARRGGAYIRDKDGVALLMAPAEQAERTREIAEIALDIVRAAMGLVGPHEDRGAEAFGGLAWLSVLPAASQRRFVLEASEALLLAASGTSLRPLELLLGDWRATAEAWADPDTRERLRAEEESPLSDSEL